MLLFEYDLDKKKKNSDIKENKLILRLLVLKVYNKD